MDGVHVNGQPGVCHVVRRLFKCRQMLELTAPQYDDTDKRDATHPPSIAPASKSANCHYPIQYKDGTGLCGRFGYPPDGMAHRHDAVVTTCRPGNFSNQSAFFDEG